MGRVVAIGIDVGGTKVAGLAVGCDAGEVLGREIERSPAADADAVVEAIVRVGLDLRAASPEAAAVGIGAAAMVDFDGVVRAAPNVAWRDLPLAERVRAAVGLPVVVDNDGNVAAWGEFRFGAGRGASNLLMVTVGTGIGGGIVAGGRLFRGAHGFAAEIGHVIVEPNGPLCGCGNRGCWEQVASGRAIGRMGREAALEHPESLILELAGGDVTQVHGPVVTEAATRGDPMAREILSEVGRRLGEGIAGLVNVLDPELVVVGGGAVTAGDLLLEPARRAFSESVEAPEHRPPVPLVAAALGNDAGAIGAADLAAAAVADGPG
jgi:glucokinase